MGDDNMISEIFEFEDKHGHKLNFFIDTSCGKIRFLQISDSEFSEFILTKPLARKIIKELKEEFKIS